MSSISLKNLNFTVFGESHGKGIGAVITGFPAGVEIDFDAIRKDMDRRKPGKDKLSTPRKEADEFEFVSGVMDGVTTGAPICVMIYNTSQHSSDYSKLKTIPRPSHSDYAAYIKYNGFNDIRGGGHFSGRLTAPIVCIGSLCKQYLAKKNITVNASVDSIGGFKNTAPEYVSEDIQKLISEKAHEGDSVGGKVQCSAKGIPAGIGGPLFEGIEGKLSQLLFGIPAVKAVEFGLGKDFAVSSGSEVNDQYRFENDKVVTTSNNNGGITGGITNGNPIDVKVTFKPTPSIFKMQQSINLETKENCDLKIQGRHDPCIVIRAVPVVEAVTAIGIMDMVM